MTLRSGLAIQAGYSPESTPGVAVTPATFLPVTDLPSVTVGGDPLESAGIIAGRRVLTTDQSNGGNLTVGGDIAHELYDHGMDVLLRSMLGKMTQTGANPGPYTHVHEPGDLGSLTLQYGVPSTGGTVVPATFSGCHVASWEIACQQGAIATLGLTLAGMSGHMGTRTETDGVTTDGSTTVTFATWRVSPADVGKPITGAGIPAGTVIASYVDADEVVISQAATETGSGVSLTIGAPLAAAVYPSALMPLKTIYCEVTVGGASTPVTSITIAGDNALATDRYRAGSPWPRQPLEAGLRSYTGTIDQEFASTAMWDRFRAGQTATVKAELARGGNSITIEGTARFDANPPTGNQRGIVSQSIPIKFLGSSSSDSAAMKITTVNGDDLS